MTLIEGEALFNDATALVAYRAAVIAAVSGTLRPVARRWPGSCSPRSAGSPSASSSVGSAGEILRRLDDPPVEVVISVVIPFAAYLPADRLGLSGVLAAVTAGLVIGSRLGTILTPSSRVLWLTTWKMIGFVLNGFVFVLIGLELPTILEGLGDRPPAELLGLAALVSAVVVVARIVWVFASSLLPGSPRRVIARRDPRLATRLTFVVSWAGLRGAVSLAAALALPADFPGARPHPARDVRGHPRHARRPGADAAAGPALGRWDGIEPDGDEATLARAAAYQAGLDEIERARAEWPAHQPLFDRLESGLRDRTQHLATEDPDETAERRQERVEHEEIQRGVIARAAGGRHRAARPGRDQRPDPAPDRARARPRGAPDGGLTARRAPRLGISSEAERTDPPADHRQPRHRAQGLGKHQKDEQGARSGGEESGDHERPDEPDDASLDGHRPLEIIRDHKAGRAARIGRRRSADRAGRDGETRRRLSRRRRKRCGRCRCGRLRRRRTRRGRGRGGVDVGCAG